MLVRRTLSVVAACALLAACGGADQGLLPRPDSGAPTTEDRGSATTRSSDDDGSTPDTTDADRPRTTVDDDDEDDDATASSTDAPAGTIDWSPCPDDEDLECGTLEVPLDYGDPEAGTVSLALQRSPATEPDERIGPLLVNPGGPGVSPLDEQFVAILPIILSDEVVERFDIVSWDPRGVGQSRPIDCVDDLDPYLGRLDPTPDTPEEQAEIDQFGRDFTAACEAQSGDLLAHVSTQDTARDMDEIRRALGEDQISYFGFSYGSQLGATFATMFPDSVRAMVIDGARNPSADYAEFALEQAVGIDRTLGEVLSACADDRGCAFYNGGDPGRAYDDLFALLDSQPLAAPRGRPAIGQAIMMWATINSLYDQSQWDSLYEALADAQDGDGTGLLKLYDTYWGRSGGKWDDTYEALIAINCGDQTEELTSADLAALVDDLAAAAPRVGAWNATQNSCTDWPTVSPALEITGAGAGPILVLANAGDPVTPIESTEAMARALDGGVLVTFQGTGHTAYIEASVQGNDCVVDAVRDYLVDLEVPEDDLDC